MNGTTLYIDNFRGFRDTYIPLKSVNFFVGENSTGKTSILSLLYLLSTPAFWHNINFNIDPIYLGGSEDMLTDRENPYITFALKKEFEVVVDLNQPLQKINTVVYVKLKFTDQIEINEYFLVNRNVIYGAKKKDTLDAVSTKFAFFKSSISDKESGETLHEIIKLYQSNCNKYSYTIDHDIFNRNHFFNVDDNIIKSLFEPDYKFTNPLFHIFEKGTKKWIAPTRVEPQPYYDNFELPYDPQGRHTPYLFKQLIKYSPIMEKINRFGEESGLWKEISIKDYNINGSSGAPFEILVNRKDQRFKISNVGYGVSQILPILVEILGSIEVADSFYIQQPELHLHPKAQSAYGTLMYSQMRYAKWFGYLRDYGFYIETHSDFLIDRFRLAMYQDESEHKPSAQVLFFESDGATNKVTPIEILPNGAYSEDQPESFREFFVNELYQLIQIPS